ncbi:MATE family efflux transporter [Citroniella saccharovorans]|uniref:MATE family efflux transporter n=1 Tax=Citroniella saccharovorans TaxID=2053367 RepID=UPI003619BBB5
MDYAGYVIINTIIGLLFLFKYVYGSAVLSMISIKSGASNKENMVKYPKYSSGLALTLYFIGAVFILIFNKNIVALFSDNRDVILIVKTYILVFIAVNSISCISYSYKLALQAINQSKFVLYTSIFIDALAVLIMFITIIVLKLSFIGLIIAIFITETLTLIFFANKYLDNIKN